ncbi:MAG: hypothetical protein M3Y28_11470 [Armatimonadota bacterium]|nr:hypothetical protein [Armatimonadota bacterium]
MEVFSGCLLLFGLPIAGIIFLAVRHHFLQVGQDAQLTRLIQDFILGHDRSRAQVQRIHALLMTQFANEPAYDAVTVAAASFMPASQPPFLDEQALTEAFQLFLQKRYRMTVQAPVDDDAVWPPPPQRGGRRNDREEEADT